MAFAYPATFSDTNAEGRLVGELGFTVASVTLSSADILGMLNTAVLIVPAPGVGKIAVPTFVVLTYHAGATPYTQASSDFDWYAGSDTATANLWAILSGNGNKFMQSATDQVLIDANVGAYPIVSTNVGSLIGDVENKGWYLASAGAITLGTGTLHVAASYVVVTP